MTFFSFIYDFISMHGFLEVHVNNQFALVNHPE